MYPALDRCVMQALLRCPSRPCHNDDKGISTKNKPPSLSVLVGFEPESVRFRIYVLLNLLELTPVT